MNGQKCRREQDLKPEYRGQGGLGEEQGEMRD